MSKKKVLEFKVVIEKELGNPHFCKVAAMLSKDDRRTWREIEVRDPGIVYDKERLTEVCFEIGKTLNNVFDEEMH
jgi:hypothetical protein